jgi:hypothetical protein
VRRLDDEEGVPVSDSKPPASIGIGPHDVAAVRNQHVRDAWISDAAMTTAAAIMEHRAAHPRHA